MARQPLGYRHQGSVPAMGSARPRRLAGALLLICACVVVTPATVLAQAALREANGFIAQGHESLQTVRRWARTMPGSCPCSST